jgi:hypothetical protein
MGFCDHCEGQRFDRAQVLRALRATRKELRESKGADRALAAAIKAVRSLEIPHLEMEGEEQGGDWVH